MISDLSDHPFAQFQRGESYVSDSERAWLKWLSRVERKLGHHLDGDQDVDGYSLDLADASFDAGILVDEFVAEVQENKAELDAAFGPLTDGVRK